MDEDLGWQIGQTRASLEQARRAVMTAIGAAACGSFEAHEAAAVAETRVADADRRYGALQYRYTEYMGEKLLVEATHVDSKLAGEGVGTGWNRSQSWGISG